MDFDEILYSWIDKSLQEPIPADVIAFSFNLFEPALGGYGIELVGSCEFDREDEDWACEETFVPAQREMNIPTDVCDGQWDECLQIMKSKIEKYIHMDRPGAIVLTKSKGVGIGFVDGNLEYIK